MATAEQIKSLIRSHFSNQPERFFTISLQLAAHEAKQGHSSLAHDIRKIVDMERKKSSSNIIHLPRDLKGLVLTEEPEIKTCVYFFVSYTVLSHRSHSFFCWISSKKICEI